jgi:hypothetical protein
MKPRHVALLVCGLGAYIASVIAAVPSRWSVGGLAIAMILGVIGEIFVWRK